jgi:hypothetical protein
MGTTVFGRRQYGCPFCNTGRICGHDGCTPCFLKSVAHAQRTRQFKYAGSDDARLINANTHKKLLLRCNLCDHTWDAAACDVFCKGAGCPYCSTKPKRICDGNKNCAACIAKSIAGYERGRRFFADTADPRTIFAQSNKKFTWKCDDPVCQFEWIATPANVVAKQSGCPQCVSSKAERLVSKHLVDEGVVYTREWWDATCRDKIPLPFDFRVGCWKTCVPFIIELDGLQHFDFTPNGVDEFEYRRRHDLHKMRWCLAHGLPVVRLLSSVVEHFNRATWQVWLARVRDEHVVPLTGRPVGMRKRIVLQDTPRYRTMFAECLEGDSQLGPYVLFVHM